MRAEPSRLRVVPLQKGPFPPCKDTARRPPSVHEPGSKPLPYPKSASTLILDVAASRIVRNVSVV